MIQTDQQDMGQTGWNRSLLPGPTCHGDYLQMCKDNHLLKEEITTMLLSAMLTVYDIWYKLPASPDL